MKRTSFKITMDAELLEEVDSLAKKDNRNRSNFIETLLKEVVEIEKKITLENGTPKYK